MKKKIKLLAVALLATITIAIAQTAKSKWAEMKTFYSFMSSTFHSAEEGDLNHLRQRPTVF